MLRYRPEYPPILNIPALFGPLLRRKAVFILPSLLATLPALSLAPAATLVFDGGSAGTGTTLDTAVNWAGDVLPGTTSEVWFNNTFTPPAQLTTTASLVWGDLIWNSATSSAITLNTATATSQTITLSGGGGSTEALAQGGAAGDLIVLGSNATASSLSIGGNAGVGTGRLNLVLGTAGNFDVVNSGEALNISSIISGAFSLNKTGAGTLSLGGTSTFGGATGFNFTLTAGTLNLNAVAALGNAGNTLIINGGTLDNTSGAALTTSAYKQTWNGDFAFTGTNSLNLGAGVVSLGTSAGTSRTLAVNGGTLTVGGIISGGTTATGLVKTGAGTLVLNGINTFAGGITITNGTAIAGVNAGFGAGTITLGDSSGSNNATLSGNNSAVTLTAANAIVVAAGSSGNTLTISSLAGG
ncbi:MAG: autotransporter, partial [Verrucomicrobiaceae bacterium]|nr:autotransporter [Verrucomicrobiaceae bacterium]